MVYSLFPLKIQHINISVIVAVITLAIHKGHHFRLYRKACLAKREIQFLFLGFGVYNAHRRRMFFIVCKPFDRVYFAVIKGRTLQEKMIRTVEL